jgi:hypothetical protein
VAPASDVENLLPSEVVTVARDASSAWIAMSVAGVLDGFARALSWAVVVIGLDVLTHELPPSMERSTSVPDVTRHLASGSEADEDSISVIVSFSADDSADRNTLAGASGLFPALAGPWSALERAEGDAAAVSSAGAFAGASSRRASRSTSRGCTSTDFWRDLSALGDLAPERRASSSEGWDPRSASAIRGSGANDFLSASGAGAVMGAAGDEAASSREAVRCISVTGRSGTIAQMATAVAAAASGASHLTSRPGVHAARDSTATGAVRAIVAIRDWHRIQADACSSAAAISLVLKAPSTHAATVSASRQVSGTGSEEVCAPMIRRSHLSWLRSKAILISSY